MTYPLSGRLDTSQRVAWMRKLLGGWAIVTAYHVPQRMRVEFQTGVSRPPP